MSERIRVTFDVEVEPTVDASAMEIVQGTLLGAMSETDLFPDKWTIERFPRDVSSEQDAPPFAMPDRIAIDAKGYGWRVWNDERHWSMIPVNPDNSPIPQPVTWFVPEDGHGEGVER